MFEMIRARGSRATLAQDLPTGAAAFLIAEMFYKWHSFTLECLGFLATWLALSALTAGLAAAWARLRADGPEPQRAERS